jgi:hypothetical protein
MNLENDLFIIYFFWIMYNIFFNLLANKFSARKKFISRKLPFIIECLFLEFNAQRYNYKLII